MSDALKESLDDAAQIIGAQRLQIAQLVATLQSLSGWIAHWQRDRAANLKPTEGSLDTAAGEIANALASPGVKL